MINALRHQRLVHFSIQGNCLDTEAVINALRHQRLVHPERPCTDRPDQDVINALRHQRLVHLTSYKAVDRDQCDQRLTASKVSTL